MREIIMEEDEGTPKKYKLHNVVATDCIMCHKFIMLDCKNFVNTEVGFNIRLSARYQKHVMNEYFFCSEQCFRNYLEAQDAYEHPKKVFS